MKKLVTALFAILPLLASAAPTQTMPDQAKKDFADGVNLAASTYKYVLVTSASTIGASTTTCAGAAAAEVANGNGYTTGGITLTRNATTISANHALLNFSSPITWSAASFTARGGYICNTTSGNVVAIYDFGSDKVSSGGDFVITIPAGAVAVN